MKKRKLLAIFCAFALTLSMSAVSLAGCGDGGKEDPDTPPVVDPDDPDGSEKPDEPTLPETPQDGYYVLTQKSVENFDRTNAYLFNCLYLQGENATWYETDYTGRNVQEGTVEETDGGITILIGLREYAFTYDRAARALLFSGKIDRQNVQMRYAYQEDYVLPADDALGALFEEELFGEDINENFYNYCPTVVMEGQHKMHVWYCSNKVSGNVTDYIAYRCGTLNSGGRWEFTEKQLVLEHGESGTWDSRHVCDPTVVQGAFSMGGEQYSWLMAFLGCKTSNNTCNEVGIAVAKAPEGPWLKVESLNPIANYYESPNYAGYPNTWGFGQPSLVSVDGAGKVLLFYAMGAAKTCTVVEEWDLSNLDEPQKLRSADVRERGVVNAGGETDCINNADFAYDRVRGRLYCIKEDFPYPTDGQTDWIAGTNTLLYLEVGDNFDLLFGSQAYLWNKFAVLDEGTGYARNHNAGFVRSGTGELLDPYRIPVLYTAAHLKVEYPDWELGGQWPSLHTYRIHGKEFTIR